MILEGAFNDTMRLTLCIQDNALDNATRTFQAAEEKMHIPQILDPADMVENPDEHSNMTYISYFRDYLERCKKREEEERLKRSKHSIPFLLVL